MAEKVKESFEFILENPVSYHKNGELEESYQFTLYAPKGKHRQELIKLKQSFFKAIADMQKMSGQQNVTNTESGDTEDIGVNEIMMILMMSDIDMNKFFEDFKSLLLKDICYVDDNVKLTDFIYNTIQLDDLERLVAEYLNNFLLSSWMSFLNGTSKK